MCAGCVEWEEAGEEEEGKRKKREEAAYSCTVRTTRGMEMRESAAEPLALARLSRQWFARFARVERIDPHTRPPVSLLHSSTPI